MLALSGNDDVTSAVDALRAGADGFLLNSSEPDELRPSAHRPGVGRGGRPAPGHACPPRRQGELGETRLAGLGTDDIALLRLVAAGLESIEIAEQLHVSERTAKRLVAALLRRIEVANRVQAAAFAGRAGLLEARYRTGRDPAGHPRVAPECQVWPSHPVNGAVSDVMQSSPLAPFAHPALSSHRPTQARAARGEDVLSAARRGDGFA